MSLQTQNQFSLVHSHGRSGPRVPNTVSWDVHPDLARRIIAAARTALRFPKHTVVFRGPDSSWMTSPRDPVIDVCNVEVAVSASDYWLEATLEDGTTVSSSHISILETAESFGLRTEGLQQQEKRRYPHRSTDDRNKRPDPRKERGNHGNRHHRRSGRGSHQQRKSARH